LQRSLPTEAPKVQEINRKRVEILTKRLEKHGKIRENCEVVDAQCAAIEDVLELIRDQSVSLRDPQQVNDQLENLVRDVEQTEETVRQVEAIFELATPEMSGILGPLPTEAPGSSAAPPRDRLRN
jgi:DNA repair ATPase RecN